MFTLCPNFQNLAPPRKCCVRRGEGGAEYEAMPIKRGVKRSQCKTRGVDYYLIS